MEPLGIAVLGCGTVGSGVVKLLTEHAERLTTRTGRRLSLRHVVVRDLAKPREMPTALLSTDVSAVIHDPSVQIVVELMGGTTHARTAVLAALAAGKHVVTANKALLAEHGPEVFAAAQRAERTVGFEASVAGGVPIIAALGQSLAANQILSLQGILNGTSNFILSSMADRNIGYAEALAEAQQLGYAEADPTLDVDGSDAAHKLALLAQLTFGVYVQPHLVEKTGISELHDMDLRFARELGYTIKLLAEAWLTDRQLALHVAPVLLRHAGPLAQVRGPFNALQVVGDVVGQTFFQGRGAGQMPTASAVLADVIDLAVGRAQRTFATLRLWETGSRGISVRPTDEVPSRFYLRLLIADEPGVLAEVARLLAEEGISISSVIQHEAQDSETPTQVPLVIMTHTASTGRFRAAVAKINRMARIAAPGVYYAVGD
jgi:homoserine dehydrogenase